MSENTSARKSLLDDDLDSDLGQTTDVATTTTHAVARSTSMQFGEFEDLDSVELLPRAGFFNILYSILPWAKKIPFSEGDLIMNHRERVLKFGTKTNFIVLSAGRQRWMERRNDRETPQIFDSKEACIAAGFHEGHEDPSGEIDPKTGKVKYIPKQFTENIDFRILLLRPHDATTSEEQVPFDKFLGDMYWANGDLSLSRGSYSDCADVVLAKFKSPLMKGALSIDAVFSLECVAKQYSTGNEGVNLKATYVGLTDEIYPGLKTQLLQNADKLM